MTGCRRCGSLSVRVEREGFTRRGSLRYATHWFRCDACQEVFLSYRRFDMDSAAVEPDGEEVADVPAETKLVSEGALTEHS